MTSKKKGFYRKQALQKLKSNSYADGGIPGQGLSSDDKYNNWLAFRKQMPGKAYADGGSNPVDPKELARLKEKYADVEPSKQKVFSAEQVESLKSKLAEIKAKDPKLALLADDMAQRKLSNNPLKQASTNMGADLNNLNAVISGANPPVDQPQLIKGTPEIINDINKIPGNNTPPIPEPVAKFSTPVDRFSTAGKPMTKIDNFAKMQADLAAKHAAKTAGLQALKKGSKKLLSAVPLVGGIAAALGSGDASAAMPMGFDSEELGPGSNTIEGRLERGERLSPEEQATLEQRRLALEALRKQ